MSVGQPYLPVEAVWRGKENERIRHRHLEPGLPVFLQRRLPCRRQAVRVWILSLRYFIGDHACNLGKSGHSMSLRVLGFSCGRLVGGAAENQFFGRFLQFCAIPAFFEENRCLTQSSDEKA